MRVIGTYRALDPSALGIGLLHTSGVGV